MKNRTIQAFLALLLFWASSSGVADVSGEISRNIADLASAPANGDFNQQGYFTFRSDLRLCPFPFCGGIFVKAVNHKLTRCADGMMQAECYVALIKNNKNIDISTAVLLRGRIKPKNFPGFGNLGLFKLKAAFSSATLAAGEGIFVGLENNGTVCIVAPCPTVDQFLLNKNKIRVISGIDLGAVGASQQNLNDAITIMADGGTLIASGINMQVEEIAGIGITFVADQFYFSIEPESP